MIRRLHAIVHGWFCGVCRAPHGYLCRTRRAIDGGPDMTRDRRPWDRPRGTLHKN